MRQVTGAKTVRWRSLDHPGLEHLDLLQTPGGVTARAVALGERNGQRYGVRYEVELSPDWTVRSVDLERTDGGTLRLEADGQERWTQDGRPAPWLSGCIDIDLSGSPFTNTLPIRRHSFVTGEPVRFRMAWIPLDTLEPFADEQIYTLIERGRFRYQSADGSFEGIIETDGDGLVTLYPGLFERM